jgi:predicted phosphohydrolase
MTIQYCSDLHLEFAQNKNYLKNHPIIPSGEILLLAGDIMPLGEIDKHNDFINIISDQFAAVYWVPGNHEYYGFDVTQKPAAFLESIRSNFFLANNQCIQYKNVNLVLSTLWSHISPINEVDILRSLLDFRAIKFDGNRLTTRQFNSLHKDCMNFLKNIKTYPNKTIVVTHHVPTLLNYPKYFKNSPLNEAFAVELREFIEDSNIDYWLYGHHHANTPEFTIGNTKLITNQFGYVSQNEHRSFRRDAIISI